MREGSEVNGNEGQEKNGSTSINQSSGLHLVQNKNLKRLLEENLMLKKEYYKAMELVDILKKHPKIKTLDDLNAYFQKIDTVEGLSNISAEYYSLEQEIKLLEDQLISERQQNNDNKDTVHDQTLDKTKQMTNMLSVDHCVDCLNTSNSKIEIKSQLKHIRWIYAKVLMSSYFNHLYENRFNLKHLMNDRASIEKILADKFDTLDNLQSRNMFSMYFYVRIQKLYHELYLKLYLSNAFKIYVKSGLYRHEFDKFVRGFIKFADSKLIIVLFKNPERYNFFKQFHRMLKENLPEEDKQLFRDYLDSCREKLQDEKDNYSCFCRREKHLTAIVIFGIIASAVVLTISLLEIYAATWFFWFGIVGVVLTVAVGIRLFFCLKENWNDLRKLTSDLQKEGKTIQDKIAEIDRAIEVYDLDKIRDFKDPELEKIPTIEIYKNEIINNGEIGTTEQNNNPKSELVNTEENI